MANYLIYIVEDDEDDRIVLKSIFDEYFGHCNLRFFEHGAQLMTHFTHQLDSRLPDLILLDLAMPVFNGFDTLRYLKNDSDLRSIPTIVLASSNREKDIRRCYDLGSNAFMTKVANYRQWLELIEKLHAYWLELGELPSAKITG